MTTSRPPRISTTTKDATCQGRRDYTGGRNNFASLDLLHRPDELAALIRRHVPLTAAKGGAP